MAIVDKIREKSGLAVGVVAFGLIMFILGSDLLSNNSFIMNWINGDRNSVGEIAGTTISIQEFDQEVEKVKENYALLTGQSPQEAQMAGIRQQAWQQLVFKYAYQEEFNKLGITITDEEIQDMVQGNNIHPAIASLFGAQNGTVDKAVVQQFLANIDQVDPKYRAIFLSVEQNLKTERLRGKYENLLTKTYYATQYEAKREYEATNSRADIRCLYIPYSAIVDSTIAVPEDRMKEYYNKNQKNYEREANVELEYLTFSVAASKADQKIIQDELAKLIPLFETADNDTAFVEANSDAQQDAFVSLNATNPAFPKGIASTSDLQKGKVYGPYKDGKSYKLYKVLAVEGDSVTGARASHILFKWDDASPEAKAKTLAEAQEALKQLQGGANFDDMATTNNDDLAAAQAAGDLGWFGKGVMVKPFEEAVFAAKSTGLIPRIIETDFGYHIVNVTGAPSRAKVTFAVVQRDITASTETFNEVYRKASEYAQYKSKEELEAAVKADKSGLILMQALTNPQDAAYINNLTNSGIRQVIRWAYNEADVNDVSPIFDLEDQYMVAVLLKRTEKGTAPFDDVKQEVKLAVLEEMKQEQIVAKLKGSNLEQMQQSFGQGATITSVNGLTKGSIVISNIGLAPETIGRIFAMQPGQVSKAIVEKSGVYVVEVIKLDLAPETADYTQYRRQAEDRQARTASYKIGQAIEKYAEAENKTYRFY